MRRTSLLVLATSLAALLAGCAVVEGPPGRPYPRYRSAYPEYPVYPAYPAPGPTVYGPPPSVYVRPAAPPPVYVQPPPPRAPWQDHPREQRRERSERHDRDREARPAWRGGEPPRGEAQRRPPLPPQFRPPESGGGH